MKKNMMFLGLCLVLFGILAPVAKVSAQELEEHTGHISDPEFSGILEQMVGNLYETMATKYTINWSVPKGRIYTSSYFKQQSGDSVAIGMELSGYGYSGIIDMDGNVRYVSGTSLYHSFSITKLQYYSFFVQNKTTSKITAKGFYTKS